MSSEEKRIRNNQFIHFFCPRIPKRFEKWLTRRSESSQVSFYRQNRVSRARHGSYVHDRDKYLRLNAYLRLVLYHQPHRRARGPFEYAQSRRTGVNLAALPPPAGSARARALGEFTSRRRPDISGHVKIARSGAEEEESYESSLRAGGGRWWPRSRG